MRRLTLWVSLWLLVAWLLAGCAGGLPGPISTAMPAASTATPSAASSTPTQAAVSPPTTEVLSPDVIAALEGTLSRVYETVNPSVVHIRVLKRGPMPDIFGPAPDNAATGSGFVWDKEGHIVTNNHVVEDAVRVWVTFADGTQVRGEVIGTDPDSDLAVLKVDVPADRLRPVTVGDSTQVKVGQLAIAIGNPFGLKGTMTVGIVSALGRVLPTEREQAGARYVIPDVIQTDAPINPGNSGGVLVDVQGRLIGVTSAIISPVRASAGIGFAIPSVIVKKVVPKLIEQGYYEHPWIGIAGVTLSPPLAEAMGLPQDQRGVLVVDVIPDSPADKAGLRGSDRRVEVEGEMLPAGGDVIVAVDGQPVRTFDDLVTYLARYTEVGQTITLTVLRDGEERTVNITLAARPSPRRGRPERQESATAGGPSWLGIRGITLTPRLAQALDLPEDLQGVLVVEVIQGSPADKAGLRGGYKPVEVNGRRIRAGGDVITAFDGHPIESMTDLIRWIVQTPPGTEVTLTIYRDGETMDVPVQLEARPENIPGRTTP